MRKYIVIVALAVAAISGGAILAQEATQEAPIEQATPATWLGIALVEQNEQIVIARVMSGSPADTANLQIGDVITAINGTDISAGAEVSELVQAGAPGDVLTIEVLRNGDALSIDAILSSAPNFGGMGRPGFGGRPGRGMGPGGQRDHGMGGLPTNALALAELLFRVKLEEADGGYTVTDVLGRNPLDLQAGDLITAVNDQAVADLNLNSLRESLQAMGTPALTITVERDGETLTLDVPIFQGGPRRFGAPMMPPVEITPESTADI